MVRKTLIIVMVLALLGFGAWFFFGRSTALPPTLTNGLPFGNGGDATSGSMPGGNTFGTTTPAGTQHIPPLFKISDAPIAGAVAFMKGGALAVRYVDRATGHIFEIDPVSLSKREIVNITVPKVYEAVWKPDGSSVIFRTLGQSDEIIRSTSYVLIPPTGTSTTDLYTTKTTALPANISEISVGQKNMFYTITGFPQITTTLFDGSKATTIWKADFTQWRLNTAGDTSVVLTTKASASADGFSYNLPVKTGAPEKLLGPLTALVTQPNASLDRMAYSYIDNGTIVLQIKNLSSGMTYTVHPTTLADKCVWGTKNTSTLYCGVPIQNLATGEPDLWYQGATHYTDRLWRFNVEMGINDVLVEPKKSFNLDIDAENLFLSPNEDYLFFQNKNDLTLWALKL